jgi:hypothetical protein
MGSSEDKGTGVFFVLVVRAEYCDRRSDTQEDDSRPLIAPVPLSIPKYASRFARSVSMVRFPWYKDGEKYPPESAHASPHDEGVLHLAGAPWTVDLPLQVPGE